MLQPQCSALETALKATLLSGAGNEQEKPLSRLIPHRAAWLGTAHHKKGRQTCFEIWRLDAAVIPIESRVAAKRMAGLTRWSCHLLPQRGTRAGWEQQAARSWYTFLSSFGSLGTAVRFLPGSMLHQILMYATESGRRSLRTKSLYLAAVPEGCCTGKWARTWPSRELPRASPS